MRNFILLIICSLTAFQDAPSANATVIFSNSEADSAIGSVQTVSGIGFRLGEEGQDEELAAQTSLFLGETLKTKNESILEIKFMDGSILDLGPKSSVRIKRYDYDSNMDFGKITVSILSGVYRFTKGRIRSQNPDDIQIDLPAGSIHVQDAIVLGQVVGKRSVVILSGTSIASTYRLITVKNRAGSKDYARNIHDIGFGSVIEDEGFAPTPPIKIPPTDIDWLNAQFLPPQPDLKDAVESAALSEPEKNKFTVQAIVHDGSEGMGGKFVVVGGKLYQEEDIVENYKILAIAPSSVKCKNLLTGEIETIKTETSTGKSKKSPAEEKIAVESIFHDSGNRQNSFAYINKILYREGEMIRDFQILEIRPKEILLLKKGGQKPLAFPLEKINPVKKELSPPQIQSIAYDKDYEKRFATIDGKTYREGEWAGGYQIFEIAPDMIWVKGKGSAKMEKISFEKARETADGMPDLRIQVILYETSQPEKSQVAINNSLYKSGDLVGGYEILEIRKTEIRVRKKGKIQWRTHVLKA